VPARQGVHVTLAVVVESERVVALAMVEYSMEETMTSSQQANNHEKAVCFICIHRERSDRRRVVVVEVVQFLSRQ
jgi:hypothetical protein